MKKLIFKIIIAGGRDYNNIKELAKFMDRAVKNLELTHKIVIISGRAKGADRLGEAYAKIRGYDIEYFTPDWKNLEVEGAVIRENSYGKYNAMAGHIRNEEMAKIANGLCCFWDGKSSGTKDMIKIAKNYNIHTKIKRY